MIKKINLEQNITSAILKAIILLVVGYLVVFFSLYKDINSSETSLNFWFQRSGSVAVLLSALAEFCLLKVNPIDINPPKLAYVADTEYSERYGAIFNLTSCWAVGTLVVGTLIWGYGDIPFIEIYK